MDNEIETLIARAETALCYVGRDEVLAELVASGVDAELAYLAVVAATVEVSL